MSWHEQLFAYLKSIAFDHAMERPIEQCRPSSKHLTIKGPSSHANYDDQVIRFELLQACSSPGDRRLLKSVPEFIRALLAWLSGSCLMFL